MNPKKIPRPARFSSIAVAGLASAFCIAGADAQVVIEGGPGIVQRTGPDGKAISVAPVPFEAEPSSAVVIETSPPAAFEIQPDTDSSVTVLVPVVPAPGPDPTIEGTAAPALRTLDVASSKRRGELVRELGIADSGTGAKIAFDTEPLYGKGSAQIDALGEESLELLAEFVRLLPVRRIVITYQFSPVLHSETVAWQRSVSLVEWLKSQGEISGVSFSVNEPTVMVEVPRAEVAADAESIPPLEKVEIIMEYR